MDALSKALRVAPRKETVKTREAYGRVLARDVVARADLPSHPVAHFDGFAISSGDSDGSSENAPVILARQEGETPVGVLPKASLRRGKAVRILTGGYLPKGADAVVPIEDVRLMGAGVELRRPVPRGNRVYAAGSDVKKGDKLLEEGRVLAGQDLVLLGSMRILEVHVFRRPLVSIIPTGSELTDDARNKGKIPESHSVLLERLVEGAGGRARRLPIVPDETAALSRALRKALKDSDVVLTLAGSSVGEPDLVDSVIRGFGPKTLLVHGLKVNRGRVMGLAVVSGKPVIILPGPIQGALNAFALMAYPLIRHLLGLGWEEPPSVLATAENGWEAEGKFRDFMQVVYVRLRRDESSQMGFSASPSTGETEKVSFLVERNAYTIARGSDPVLRKGETVKVRLLPGFSSLG